MPCSDAGREERMYECPEEIQEETVDSLRFLFPFIFSVYTQIVIAAFVSWTRLIFFFSIVEFLNFLGRFQTWHNSRNSCQMPENLEKIRIGLRPIRRKLEEMPESNIRI